MPQAALKLATLQFTLSSPKTSSSEVFSHWNAEGEEEVKLLWAIWENDAS